MSFEQLVTPENPEAEQALCELWDFTLERVMCQDLLPDLDGKNTFEVTSIIEDACSTNPNALIALNKNTLV